MKNLDLFADELIKAQESVYGIAPLTDREPSLSVEEAYSIQISNINKKIDAGRRIVGKKIGLTSLGMMRLLGVNEPDYGVLLDDMIVSNGGSINACDMISPKVECEIAFVLKDDLAGKDIKVSDVINATSYITPALEIVDSRVADWKIKLPDTIADNASSGRFVISESAFDLKDYNLKTTGMYLEKNDVLCNSATGVEVMGNPVISVAWLANKLNEFGMPLRAGEIILSGAFAAAIEAKRDRKSVV